MIQNIFVGAMAVIALGVVIFGWWLENGNTHTEHMADAKEAGKPQDSKEV
jgi:pyrimidine deaminase RibD-like protein